MAAQDCQATPGYFRPLGIPVVVGREFETTDGPTGPVVLVNDALAKRFPAAESVAAPASVSAASSFNAVRGQLPPDFLRALPLVAGIGAIA
jgi:hypothetical protein